ncbi:MAG: hypothetical protein KJ976_09540, partial [Proteobacteria bacterium]|nr:hypothetical protein [Pseudomonadota bacterium]MBU4415328.1 hypothetical protein [Pseudomonadota bacterium]
WSFSDLVFGFARPGATCYPALVCTALYGLSQGISLLICRHGLGQGFEFRISTFGFCLNMLSVQALIIIASSARE